MRIEGPSKPLSRVAPQATLAGAVSPHQDPTLLFEDTLPDASMGAFTPAEEEAPRMPWLFKLAIALAVLGMSVAWAWLAAFIASR